MLVQVDDVVGSDITDRLLRIWLGRLELADKLCHLYFISHFILRRPAERNVGLVEERSTLSGVLTSKLGFMIIAMMSTIEAIKKEIPLYELPTPMRWLTSHLIQRSLGLKYLG